MAGHSKFANIKHRKGAQDIKRGKVFTKLQKEITVAVKTGGGGDPAMNPRLRLALANARGANMPKDNIERAIKKAEGSQDDNFVEVTFEGYGPDGTAVFVECATDNNTRTVSNIRSYFNKYGGSLGKDGCLEFIFTRKGLFHFKADGLNEEDFTMEMIDAGAEDVEFEGEIVTVVSEMEEFGNISKKLQELEIETLEAGLKRVPNTTKEVNEKSYPKFEKLIDIIEDDDDVQKVYHNAVLNEA